MTTVYRGMTVRFTRTVKDFDGTLIDADSHDIKIYDPDGTEKYSSTSPTKTATGTYRLDYTIPSDGTVGVWEIRWKVSKGSSVGEVRLKFKVED